MNEIVFTPGKVLEIVEANSPSTLTISKKNMAFNLAAAARLALKVGVKFQLIIKDNKLFYKDTGTDGFEIMAVAKHCVICNNSHIHQAFQSAYRENTRAYKFKIGEFIEGMRLLTPIE